MPSKNLRPALVGGLFIGVLSALPFISALNVCCCAWVIAGGIVTAYLMQDASATAITTGDGALGGLVAGIIGAVVATILSIPINLIAGPITQRALQRWLEMSPEIRDAMPSFFAPGMGAGVGFLVAIVFGFFVMLVFGAIFGTVGGMIGAAIFSRGKPTVVSGPPAAPPPSPASPIPPSPPPPQA